MFSPQLTAEEAKLLLLVVRAINFHVGLQDFTIVFICLSRKIWSAEKLGPPGPSNLVRPAHFMPLPLHVDISLSRH